MACVAVLSLMRTLELEFLQPHPRPILQQNELIPLNKDLVQSLHGKLGSLVELFDENMMDGVKAIKQLETRLRDVAFRVEDEIELQVVHLYEEKDKPLWDTLGRGCSMLCQIFHRPKGKPDGDNDVEKTCPSLRLGCILQQAIQHIDAIKEELVKLKEDNLQGRKAALDVLPKSDEVITKSDSSQDASQSKEIMVGKQDEFEIIKKMLIEHPSKQREVVSIKGMGGIGKTTLAKRVYEDLSKNKHFDKRAWVVVSQHHNKRQMLQGLLNSIGNAGSDSDSEEDLALQLYQGLKGVRYLVVMDDIWSVEAWDAIKACFPDDKNSSRVLLTTRLAEVANHISSNNNFSHQVNLLNQSESWNLFCEKACKSHGVKFESIGRAVVEKCKGLPLAIVVVAGLFSQLKTLDEWENTANALNSSSTTTLDDEECSRILSLSYNHLPYNLKACFLFLGVFPEDHEMNANELTRLWFAEGLIKELSFDVVVNRYIQELMDRNLIILSKLSSCGRIIKTFRMHDLLHAFCVREAQNQKLLLVVRSENSCDFPQKVFRWVSIQSVNFNMSTLRSRLKSCRSFFSFSDELCFNFKNFNLLRVVYFNDFDPFVAWIKKLVDSVHLRFLKSVCSGNIQLSRAGGFLKSWRRRNIQLSRAWNLQTLECFEVSCRSNGGGKYLEFPQLQYIHCLRIIQGSPPNFVRQIRWLSANYCSKEYIMNTPYLKKVCIGDKSRECSDCITNLAYLEQLERLSIYGDGTPTAMNNHILLLKNLRKLVFSNTGFEWKEINVLSKLPRLEVLTLKISCKGKEWEIPDEEEEEEVIFSKLICLYIFEAYLEHWKASSHNFPELEYLQLFNCSELREIPISFVDILTLKSIKLERCLPSAVMSAKQIQVGQHEYGNENMIVIEEDKREFFELKSSELDEFLLIESDEHESD